MKKTKPQLTAKIMRPEHPCWPDFCSRLKEALAHDNEAQENGDFSLTTRRILEEMGFTKCDVDVTMLYLFRRWVLRKV